MFGKRMREIRKERSISLVELGHTVNKSPSTLSRYEKSQIVKLDPEVVTAIAKELDTSAAYLMGMTDDPNLMFDMSIKYFEKNENISTIFVTDEEMSPDIPYGAMMNIRPVVPNEKLQVGAFYYIKFNNKKCFRMVVEDDYNGIGFLPNDMSERRIGYDPEYVDIIGKAVSMNVIFEDDANYE